MSPRFLEIDIHFHLHICIYIINIFIELFFENALKSPSTIIYSTFVFLKSIRLFFYIVSIVITFISFLFLVNNSPFHKTRILFLSSVVSCPRRYLPLAQQIIICHSVFFSLLHRNQLHSSVISGRLEDLWNYFSMAIKPGVYLGRNEGD